MARTGYTMFVDEVKATPPFTLYNFTGVIFKQNDIAQFEKDLNSIKANGLHRVGGVSVNLHYTALTKRRQNTPFESLTKFEEEALWKDLYDLFATSSYNLIASTVHKDFYNNKYVNFRVNVECLAFKVLLQNYARFLHLNNGYGNIIVESSPDDNKLAEEYYRTKLLGSKYITSDGYNKVFRGISFKDKSHLLPGLQLVDFLANPVSRMLQGMKQFDLSKFDSTYDYESIIKSKTYSGPSNEPFEFGIRKVHFRS